MSDPAEQMLQAVRDDSEEIEWNGHMKHGDTIILMFMKEDAEEMTYIETDKEGVEELIENLEMAKSDL